MSADRDAIAAVRREAYARGIEAGKTIAQAKAALAHAADARRAEADAAPPQDSPPE